MSVEKRVSDRTGKVSWRAIIWVGGRSAVSQTFRRRQDAEAFEREGYRRLERGEGLLDPVGAKKSVAWWADRYTALHSDVAPATVQREDSLLRTHVLPKFGRLPVSMLRRSDVQAWVNELAKRRSPSTARLALGVLRGVLRVAVDDRALAVNPSEKITVRGVKPGKPRVVSHEQIAGLVKAVPAKQDEALILVLAYMGLRWGEAAALVWSDLVSDGFVASVSKAVRRGDESYMEVGPTKTHQRRVVPVPELVRVKLLELWSERYGDGSALKQWPEVAPWGRELVFISSVGGELSNANWRNRVLIPACEQAGIEPAATPHQLRDSFASLSVAAGASIAAVSKNLGHGQVSTTLRHYIDVLPAEQAAVAVSLNTAAAAAASRVPTLLPLPESGDESSDPE
ncbi:tyrosine-type recombinase/integrase [Corynebacterium sp. AOP36-E1-14]|uniref:tyrosine-type recombinase/integrase n=1 Tax=Corynebacterium sp. TaxID=1720 RepID=UPI003F8FA570